MTNTDARDAKRIIHELHPLIHKHIPKQHLPAIAKGQAKVFNIPQKIMLKAMSRYIRIHHSN